MHRLCIYLTYDKQNVIDGYIGYMLKELKICVDYLVVVCNETYVENGLNFLETYADDIFYRENIGFDAGGFKDALCKFIGWDKLENFDELILVNDSFFGPFCPMTDIFERMQMEKVDFWGLSKHGKWEEKGIIFPEHLQSFFLAIRKKMMQSKYFRKYWENMPYYKTLHEVVMKHEVNFTSYFASCGFSYSCIADMCPNDSSIFANNFIQYARLSYELIKKRKFPFLKKQPLANDTIFSQTQENLRLALEYIDKKTTYDVNLIWDNILRTFNIADLQRSLHLQYVISNDEKLPKRDENVTIVVIIKHMESKEYILEYLESLKELYKIYICVFETKLLVPYKESGFQTIITEKVNDYVAIVEKLNDDGIACFLHDVDMTGNMDPSYIGKSYFYNIWNNLLKNYSYIQEVIELFKKEPRLGLLAPPRVNFGKYFNSMGEEWKENFEIIKNAASQLHLLCQISKENRPLMDTDNFWIRTNIMKKAVKKAAGKEKYLLPSLWCYIVQNMGFYSGIVESVNYSAINEINLQHYLDMITDQVRRQYGDFSDFHELYRHILQGAIAVFCNKMKTVYIYGTGIKLKECYELIPFFNGYIVSDGQVKEDRLNGKKVMYLSEVDVEDDVGIIVCVGKRNQKQIVPLLEQKGWKNYLCV